MIQRILLAWDGSAVALRAFDTSIDITRRYDAELVVVSIAYSPAHAETRADRLESSTAARTYLTQTFEEVADRAERAGVAVEHRVLDAQSPVRALVDFGHEHGFDLIVCGHHRSGRGGRLLLRGVARELIEATTIPVLVIGSEEE